MANLTPEQCREALDAMGLDRVSTGGDVVFSRILPPRSCGIGKKHWKTIYGERT